MNPSPHLTHQSALFQATDAYDKMQPLYLEITYVERGAIGLLNALILSNEPSDPMPSCLVWMGNVGGSEVPKDLNELVIIEKVMISMVLLC